MRRTALGRASLHPGAWQTAFPLNGLIHPDVTLFMRYLRIILFALVATVSTLLWVRPRPANEPVEWPVLASLREIQSAQVRYYSLHGNYGGVVELGPEAASAVSSAFANGYRLNIELTRMGYVVRALPLARPGPSYYSDETLVVHRSSNALLVDTKSPVLK